jgi:itaconate CoA-transferase
MGALEGVTVVALEQAVAAPFATRQLADLGARVIKVEREGVGDFARQYDESVNGMSSHFVWLNRGKESITLDIKQPADLQLLESMLASADVFVQSLAPGATARLGLDGASLRKKFPRLITCTLTGYGASGPYEHKKAYDLLIQAEAGMLAVTGTEEAPARAGISIADISAGMYILTGVLAALFERERTGEGSDLQVAMLDALGEWMSQPYLYSYYRQTDVRRSGMRHPSISPYGPYRVKDDAQVFIGVQNEREWVKFCEDVLGQPELIADPRFDRNSSRVRNDVELVTIVEKALSAYTADEVVERLDTVGIANSRLRTMHEFAEHPQLIARDRWRSVDTPVGPVRMLLPPVEVAGREAGMGAVPSVGEHGDAIRAEFGYSFQK